MIPEPEAVNNFTILKKVKATIPLNSQLDKDPIEEPIPLTLKGKIYEMISQPRGPRLMAKKVGKKRR